MDDSVGGNRYCLGVCGRCFSHHSGHDGYRCVGLGDGGRGICFLAGLFLLDSESFCRDASFPGTFDARAYERFGNRTDSAYGYRDRAYLFCTL